MFHLSLIAAAGPDDGDYYIKPGFEHLTKANGHIEAYEDAHRTRIIDDISRPKTYPVTTKPTTSPRNSPLKRRKSPRRRFSA